MKIILSRKGLDTGSGNSPSPLFIDEKKMFSIPIPSGCGYYKYSDLRFNDQLSCYDLMNQLGITRKNTIVHSDPDIRKDLFYKPDDNWKPIFGQQGGSQRHLRNYGVGANDIFLFWGLFQNVEKINGSFKFIGGTKKNIIWGYMQVDKVLRVFNNNENIKHPHFYCYDKYSTKDENTVYYANDLLSLDSNLPGYGHFNYDDSLVLSNNCGHTWSDYMTWELPDFFYEERITNNPNPENWSLEDGKCLLKTPMRGQEFIIPQKNEQSANQQTIDWTLNIITKGLKEII